MGQWISKYNSDSANSSREFEDFNVIEQRVVSLPHGALFNPIINDTQSWSPFVFSRKPESDRILDIGKTSLLRSPFIIYKDTIQLRRIVSNKNNMKRYLEFKFDSYSVITLNIFLIIKEMTGLDTPNKLTFEAEYRFESTHPIGKNQLYNSQEINLESFIKFLCRKSEKLDKIAIICTAHGPLPKDYWEKVVMYIDLEDTHMPQMDIDWKLKCTHQQVINNNKLIDVNYIYGLENINSADSSGSSCVICLSAPPTVVIMPCRHLCICEDCVKEICLKSNQCPLCRQPRESFIYWNRSMSC